MSGNYTFEDIEFLNQSVNNLLGDDPVIRQMRAEYFRGYMMGVINKTSSCIDEKPKN